MSAAIVVQLLYLAASILFILGLRGLASPESARRGVWYAEVGMLFAVIGTLVRREIVSYEWILAGMVVGSLIGTAISLTIPMTKMPERIAFSHAFGGLAVMLVGVSEHYHRVHAAEGFDLLSLSALSFEVLLGAVTFTGSLIAFAKLQGMLPGRPLTFPGQNAANFLLMGGAVALGAAVIYLGGSPTWFYALAGLGLFLGVSVVIPVGGADMPVVICLLNSYAGLAAAATGFALHNNALIICGALDGGSGFLLGVMMSKAMNRSFSNVLFGAFGTDGTGAAPTQTIGGRAPNEATPEEAAELLRAARSVIVIPGSGMAVSQAQHALRELAEAIAANGGEVRYAIHPVAGRMPGHMNVLLAEANIPYEQLFDLDAINDDFGSADVVLVVGANDVVNPAARENPQSPIFGMPVFNVEKSKATIVLKRSLNPGFAGIENALFVKEKTMMVLGDAKKSLLAFVSALKIDG